VSSHPRNPPAAPAGEAPDPALLRRAVDVLCRGGLVAFPTETVYGLGADADSKIAVEGIFRAKGRPPSHPLIVHLAEPAAADAWAADVPREARVLMQRLWPGPLTFVLPRSARAVDAVTGGQPTVGLRCPSHPWAQALLRAFCAARGDAGAGVAAPSANRYGRISPTSAAHVRADLGERPNGSVDLILDGGSCPLGIESTIVDFPGGATRILRPGSIDAGRIAALLGSAVRVAADAEDAPRASGRLRAHYAPAKRLELVAPKELAARVRELGAARVAVLAPAAARLGESGEAPALWLIASADPQDYAHDLYEYLHRLDASAAQVLLVALPPRGDRWTAIHDRLARAAAGASAAIPDAD
jgi:L-threonylcarbamoyladenylate synthase